MAELGWKQVVPDSSKTPASRPGLPIIQNCFLKPHTRSLKTTIHVFIHIPQMSAPTTMVGNHGYNKEQERQGSFSLGTCEGDRPEVGKYIILDIPGTSEDNKIELWESQHWVLEGLF